MTYGADRKGRGRELCRHLGSGRPGEAEDVGDDWRHHRKRSYKDLSEMGCHTAESYQFRLPLHRGATEGRKRGVSVEAMATARDEVVARPTMGALEMGRSDWILDLS